MINKHLIRSILLRLPHNVAHYLYKLLNKVNYNKTQSLRKYKVKGEEYTLSGFDEKECIFIHIPKAAGISLNMILFGNLGGGHRFLSDYIFIYKKAVFNNFYKFSIVRNPWDRLVSSYLFLKEGGFNAKDEFWFKENIAKFSDFEDFVLNWVNKYNIYSYIHFIPQFKYVSLHGQLIVDEVYKLEELSSKTDSLNKRLKTNIIIPHKNKTKSRDSDYRSYYSSKTRLIVENVYKEDIKLFNYSF